MHISYCFDDRPDLELCKQMRALRVANKEFKKLETYSLLRKLKSFLRRRLTVYFPNYLPLCDDRKSRFLTAYINNELASFFNYGYDVYHQEVVMMAVGLNEKYRSYSPGILLLYEYIQQQITEKELKLIDFTRGTEKYKYTLGGVDHAIHNVMFEV